MQRISVADGLSLSRLIHGFWRATSWGYSSSELLDLIYQGMDLGITSFDHADIYGDYEAEGLFGKALRHDPGLRSRMEIITKCGIKLKSKKFPERAFKTYDYSREYIQSSVDRSLKQLKTDYIDVLLLHRPSPFFDPDETAGVLSSLISEGKVRYAGVSNFSAQQFELLQSRLDFELVTNQIQLSPLYLNHLQDGLIEFMQTRQVRPMIWSPLGHGKLFEPTNEREERVRSELLKIQEELSAPSLDQVILAWTLAHPSSGLPILGTGKLQRLVAASNALDLKMSSDQWLQIYIASMGEDLP